MPTRSIPQLALFTLIAVSAATAAGLAKANARRADALCAQPAGRRDLSLHLERGSGLPAVLAALRSSDHAGIGMEVRVFTTQGGRLEEVCAPPYDDAGLAAEVAEQLWLIGNKRDRIRERHARELHHQGKPAGAVVVGPQPGREGVRPNADFLDALATMLSLTEMRNLGGATDQNGK